MWPRNEQEKREDKNDVDNQIPCRSPIHRVYTLSKSSFAFAQMILLNMQVSIQII